MAYYRLYDLTEMVGAKAGEKRQITFLTFDFKPKVLIAGVAAAFPGFILASLFWTVMGSWAFIFPMVIISASVWAFNARTNDSRNMLQYRAIEDNLRGKKVVNKFYIGAIEVDPDLADLEVLHQNALPPGQSSRVTSELPQQQAERFNSVFQS